jgi:hypothetical protein
LIAPVSRTTALPKSFCRHKLKLDVLRYARVPPRVNVRWTLRWQFNDSHPHYDGQWVDVKRIWIQFNSSITSRGDCDCAAIHPIAARNIVQFIGIITKTFRSASF